MQELLEFNEGVKKMREVTIKSTIHLRITSSRVYLVIDKLKLHVRRAALCEYLQLGKRRDIDSNV